MKHSEAEFIILGSGTCIPMANHGAAGIVIKIDDVYLLWDSGSGILQKLSQVGVDFHELRYLFYTHTHIDHIADLVPILQAITVSPLKKRTMPLHIYGPPHFSDFMETLAQAYGQWVTNPDFSVSVAELEQAQLDFDFGKISTAPMRHARSSIGYRLDLPNKVSLTYSGDTDYCEEIIALADHTDFLILECSFPDHRKMEGHLTPSLAAQIAAAVDCQHLILTHRYPVFENIDIEAICRKYYHGRISLAHDRMLFSLQPGEFES